MTLLKDDRTLKLDDVGMAVTQALGLYRDLEERIEDAELRTVLHEHVDRHSQVLQNFEAVRREHGDLPQGVDPERSHLEAAGAYLRAIVLPGETETHVVETMIEAAADVASRINAALVLELGPELESSLLELRTVNDAFRTRLREIASPTR